VKPPNSSTLIYCASSKKTKAKSFKNWRNLKSFLSLSLALSLHSFTVHNLLFRPVDSVDGEDSTFAVIDILLFSFFSFFLSSFFVVWQFDWPWLFETCKERDIWAMFKPQNQNHLWHADALYRKVHAVCLLSYLSFSIFHQSLSDTRQCYRSVFRFGSDVTWCKTTVLRKVILYWQIVHGTEWSSRNDFIALLKGSHMSRS